MDSTSFEQKFSCPICFEVPKRKIFQCRNGHILCESCSKQLQNCPQCRVYLEANKIRNLALEDMLKDLASLRKFRRNNGATSFYGTERQYSTGNSSTNNGILFNVQCQWCMEIPLKHARYVCLTCRSINCCAKCFSTSSKTLVKTGSGRAVKCRQNHAFALITTAAQDNAFKKAHIERNGAPFLKDVSSRTETIETCSRCQTCKDWLTEGYICLMDNDLQLFCSTCFEKTSFFSNHRNSSVPVSNRAQTLLSIEPNPTLPAQLNVIQNYISFNSSVNGFYKIAFQMRKEFFFCLLFLLLLLLVDAFHNPEKYISISVVIGLYYLFGR